MEVDVIIPVYNEENVLRETLSSLENKTWVKNIIVIDDGSVDQSVSIARQFTNDVVACSKNLGKAAAVIKGLEYVKSEQFLMLDADLGVTVSEADKLLLPLKDSSVDMTVARFPKRNKEGIGLVRQRAQKYLKRQTGFESQAPLSGQRAIRKKWIPFIQSCSAYGYGFEMVMTLQLLRNGAKVIEIVTDMDHRRIGKTPYGFYHRAKQWIDMERSIWRYKRGI
ncbi:glycosyltransferase family 2 protein [Texcoconibacillus texcoconensis]|uniref:Glycosyltransferase involved in cell wall biosynthesis n=1 Tax=Texcoconibacillus texcoconensis TaxID=1095777 RepID=A0A840QNY6_9BACI|nr:glycosyltransferase family 2 protein [Texcoconibacillus texcoconensis]MBB5173053.1 glycosyltransferase involved in cell wall biosynthesis [Texcoconibacillus texcoconensis]